MGAETFGPEIETKKQGLLLIWAVRKQSLRLSFAIPITNTNTGKC